MSSDNLTSSDNLMNLHRLINCGSEMRIIRSWVDSDSFLNPSTPWCHIGSCHLMIQSLVQTKLANPNTHWLDPIWERGVGDGGTKSRVGRRRVGIGCTISKLTWAGGIERNWHDGMKIGYRCEGNWHHQGWLQRALRACQGCEL